MYSDDSDHRFHLKRQVFHISSEYLEISTGQHRAEEIEPDRGMELLSQGMLPGLPSIGLNTILRFGIHFVGLQVLPHRCLGDSCHALADPIGFELSLLHHPIDETTGAVQDLRDAPYGIELLERNRLQAASCFRHQAHLPIHFKRIEMRGAVGTPWPCELTAGRWRMR